MEKELLYRFFNGETSVAEEKVILDWLEASPEHRTELLAERKLFDAMLLHVSPDSQTKRRILPQWVRSVTRYAAVFILAAGLGGVLVPHLRDRGADLGHTISVPAGQHVDVTLPDGTHVCVNALSELRFPGSFSGRQRRVQLRGEAFFDVNHDARHPFVVETYACDVEVLGTKFDVEARPESDEFTTSLVEGRVRVTDRSNADNWVELRPDHRVSRTDGRLVVDRIPDHERFLWREGLISFRDVSFRELLDRFENYFGVTIHIRRADVTENRFTGKIRISEGIDHALWVLQRSADFTYTRDETRNEIYIQ